MHVTYLVSKWRKQWDWSSWQASVWLKTDWAALADSSKSPFGSSLQWDVCHACILQLLLIMSKAFIPLEIICAGSLMSCVAFSNRIAQRFKMWSVMKFEKRPFWNQEASVNKAVHENRIIRAPWSGLHSHAVLNDYLRSFILAMIVWVCVCVRVHARVLVLCVCCVVCL